MAHNSHKPLTIRSLVLSAVLVPLLLATLVAAIFYYMIGQFITTSRELDGINEAISLAQRSLKLLVDMETGQRGFLVGGKTDFLQPYDAAKREFPAIIASLSKKNATIDPQDTTLERIIFLTDQWQQNASLELVEKQRGLNYIDTFNAAKGKTLMDGIRREFDSLIEKQETRRAYIISSAAGSARFVLWGA